MCLYLHKRKLLTVITPMIVLKRTDYLNINFDHFESQFNSFNYKAGCWTKPVEMGMKKSDAWNPSYNWKISEGYHFYAKKKFHLSIFPSTIGEYGIFLIKPGARFYIDDSVFRLLGDTNLGVSTGPLKYLRPLEKKDLKDFFTKEGEYFIFRSKQVSYEKGGKICLLQKS